ncbi:hypothetical protein [Raineyella sp.]|uniref:Uncharacterized protein n=1 Tax=bioreactor metagenome TaxID=1076179 RepID=A0A644X530_9ZZZZ|nr:hypothetical protein [Raineyella sp.]MEA5155755.1 hypothetical protein [Raineyella sp.]
MSALTPPVITGAPPSLDLSSFGVEDHLLAPAPGRGSSPAPAGGGLPAAVPSAENTALAAESFQPSKTGKLDSDVSQPPSIGVITGIGRGAPSLGCPPLVSKLDSPAGELDDELDSAAGGPVPGYRVVASTPEQVAQADAFFEREKAAETEAQKVRAQGRATVFTLMQYRVHPDTGEVLITEEHLDRLRRWDKVGRIAVIWHDQDVFDEAEAQYQRSKGRSVSAGDLKPLHAHVVLWFEQKVSIRAISDVARIPSARIKMSNEELESAGEDVPVGRNARERAHYLCVQYLLHEGKSQQDKHRYDRREVWATFDVAAYLGEMALRFKGGQSAKAGQRASLKKRDAIREAVMLGDMTMKEVRETERTIYIQDLEKLQKLRQDFLLHQPAPRHRTNYYIGSPAGAQRKGRTGKTQLAKLFARMLYPDLDAEECYHVATDARVPLQNYKGQPVIIWDDYSVPGLLAALGSREGVWQVFDDHPSASDANIKYGSVRLVHVVNIIAKTTPYAEYLDGLAGKYTDASGNVHEAEDRNQSWGRFPVVFEVTTDSIEMLLNRGFADDTDDFLAYQKVARMRASMKTVCSALDSIESEEEREAATFSVGEVLLRPIIDQHHALQPVANRVGADIVGELLAGIEVLDAEALEQVDAAAAEEAAARDHEVQLAEQLAELEDIAEANRLAQICTCPHNRRTGSISYRDVLYRSHEGGCPVLVARESELREQLAAV